MCFMEFPCIYRRTSTSNIYICVYIYIYTLYMYIVKLPSFRVNMWHHLHFPESARGIVAASILQGWEGRGVKVASAGGKLDRSEGLTFTVYIYIYKQEEGRPPFTKVPPTHINICHIMFIHFFHKIKNIFWKTNQKILRIFSTKYCDKF